MNGKNETVILRIPKEHRERMDAFIREQWFTLQMVVHGEVIDLGQADGFYMEDEDGITGMITFRFMGDVMEILSVDSLKPGNGIGSALLEVAVAEAENRRCVRIVLTTTNDNTHALHFYQKHGFDMCKLHRNALDEARRMKPEIPLFGMDDIPLRHEIEMERIL